MADSKNEGEWENAAPQLARPSQVLPAESLPDVKIGNEKSVGLFPVYMRRIFLFQRLFSDRGFPYMLPFAEREPRCNIDRR
ncbi:MAG: hypothetical protein CMO74_02865 [Verrucomicrobiales bacterium]|nr:hypothetical protein [Verrucomicrobiales bacterium]